MRISRLKDTEDVKDKIESNMIPSDYKSYSYVQNPIIEGGESTVGKD